MPVGHWQHERATSATTPNPEPFGYLATLDLYGCKAGVCNDLNVCYAFLEALVAALGMEIQAPPYLIRTDHRRFPDKEGLSGWVGLVESGIQIHTLELKRFISIDIYCCRNFENGDMVEVAKRFFGQQETEINRILRGLKYNEVR